MELNIQGKRALVTGGSKGIGKAIAEALRKEGCIVDICSRTKGIIVDVLKRDLSMIKGDYDILINNVGGGGRWGSEEYEEFDEWEDVYEKNAGVARKLTMKCLHHMKKQKWGRVITIASTYGKEAGGRPWFNMAKAAEISLMKSLAGKYKGITFNSIAPGQIDIGRITYDPNGKIENSEEWGKPEDVAGIVVFLCSDKAKHINGACITVDGGESRSF